MSQSQPVSWECAPAAARGGGVGKEPVSASALAALLDALPQPLVLVGDSGAIRHANRAATELLHAGHALCERDGRLIAAQPADAARLRRAIEVTGADNGGDGVAVVSLQRETHEPLTLLLWHINQSHSAAEPLVGVFAGGVAPASHLDATLLRRLYGFTRAEARVATLIAGGNSVGEIAAQLRIGRSTARTHLQKALAKSGSRRQATLTRLLLNGPAQLRIPVQPAHKSHAADGSLRSGKRS